MAIDRDRKARGESVVTGHLLILISVGLTVGILILIGVLFVVNFTTGQNDLTQVAAADQGGAIDSTLTKVEGLREQRFDQMKEMLRVLVIALAIPVLALVLGYFLERTPRSERTPVSPPVSEPDLE